VATVPEVTLGVKQGEDATIGLLAATGEAVAFRCCRNRGAGTIPLAAGTRLILVSLRVAIWLQFALADAAGEALDTADLRVLLARIPFPESGAEVERLAAAVGLLPRRVHLTDLAVFNAHRGPRRAFFT